MFHYKTRSIIWLLILFSFLIICLIIMELLNSQDYSHQASEFLTGTNLAPFQGERVVHLDLKGAPPSILYLKKIFPLFRSLGVTSVLVEYEDMFPYSNKYTSAINAYSKGDIKTLLNVANQNHITIIPLLQTFGHLEFILKSKSFSYLREESKYPQTICPSHNDTMPIITGLLDEIIDLHPQIRYIHIGCDEVYQLGFCRKCTKKMLLNHWSTDELFLDHVIRIAKYIRSKYPNIVPLMWDDQLRQISEDKLKTFNVGALIEPVIWFYKPKISLPLNLWKKYGRIFNSVWVASSFKGTTGSNQIITNISYHVQNQISWMHIVAKNSNLINFKGVIITGWQRYDHFAVLCELLPVSIPSLVHVTNVLDGKSSAYKNMPQKIRNIIACRRNDDFSPSCTFPGVEIYQAVLKFARLRNEIDDVFSSFPVKGWFTAYNVKIKYFNTLLAQELAHRVLNCQSSLKNTKILLQDNFKMVYDKYTVTEWIETYVQPYESKLNNISGILSNLANITEWGPRYDLFLLN